jgi:hypothetical protein
MVQMRETGKPCDTVEFTSVVRAESKDEAFEEYCKIHKFDISKFRKTGENRWYDYYPVYVQEM